MVAVWKRPWGSLLQFSIMVHFCLLSHHATKHSALSCRNIGSNTSFVGSSHGVKLIVNRNEVEMDNGIVKVTLSRPHGNVQEIKYHGEENLLDTSLNRHGRVYWDYASEDVNGRNSKQIRISGGHFRIIMETRNQVEVSFKTTWKPSDPLPALNVDKRYIMRFGSSGFYTYAIYERPKGWPGMFLWETRVVFKLSKKLFEYMAISNTRQRVMPTTEDRARGKPLAYPEAVQLRKDSKFGGEVDDKYQYSSHSKDDSLHGWISLRTGIGFWIIRPSSEFLSAGPLKQDLTCHVGPTCLSMFMSAHYSGVPLNATFQNGEPWKKVFGPVFIYLNSVSSNRTKATSLWDNAKRQTRKEIRSWPYKFPGSPDFLKSDKRGSVTGRLTVQDRYLKAGNGPARFAHVGLAAAVDVESWEFEIKGYQFWNRTDERGSFFIKAVLPGTYSLHAWVPGVMGNYKYEASVTITQGSHIKLPPLVFKPPRYGPTLWKIGIADRKAAEFHVPNATKLINKLYTNQDAFRQYGLWRSYTELYPEKDLVFTVGTSDYAKDWFFAHGLRILKNGELKATTWQIVFDLPKVYRTKTYKLRLVLAAAHLAEVQIRVNHRNSRPDFTTGLMGRDSAIARHGIHGVLRSFTADLPGHLFVKGRNTIFLVQSRNEGFFRGVMYDYIRLEGPASAQRTDRG